MKQSPQIPQQKKPQNNSDQSARQKVLAAKTTLGLKDLNVAAAISAHKKIKDIATKNPNLPFNQVLTRVSPEQRKHYIDVASHVPSDSLEKDVSMTQFRRQLQILKPSKKPLMNSIDILDKEQISEALQDEIQPPPMLVLRRKGIRIFPDGRRVALYTNDKLGLVFTIPYTPNNVASPVTIPGVQGESVEESVATAQKVMDRANVVAKTNPDAKKRFAAGGLAQKAMMRTINPTGVNTGITRGGGNKTYRKITGKAPPYQLTKKTGVSEEVEDIMESLDQVASYAQEESPKAMAKHMKFADGSKLKVSHGAAKAIHMVHGALNDENKKKFADMLTHPKGFEKAAHFALSKVNFTIGDK